MKWRVIIIIILYKNNKKLQVWLKKLNLAIYNKKIEFTMIEE